MADRSAYELACDVNHARGALKAMRAAREAVAACDTLEQALDCLDAMVLGAAIRFPLTERAAQDAAFDDAAAALMAVTRGL